MLCWGRRRAKAFKGDIPIVLFEERAWVDGGTKIKAVGNMNRGARGLFRGVKICAISSLVRCCPEKCRVFKRPIPVDRIRRKGIYAVYNDIFKHMRISPKGKERVAATCLGSLAKAVGMV